MAHFVILCLLHYLRRECILIASPLDQRPEFVQLQLLFELLPLLIGKLFGRFVLCVDSSLVASALDRHFVLCFCAALVALHLLVEGFVLKECDLEFACMSDMLTARRRTTQQVSPWHHRLELTASSRCAMCAQHRDAIHWCSATLRCKQVDMRSATREVANRSAWLRIPFTRGFALCAELDSCWVPFCFNGMWHDAGTHVVVYHATKYSNLHGPTITAPGSHGIFVDRALMTGHNGHLRDYGVFVHSTVGGAAWYVQSSRPQWPKEPMCFIEATAVSLKTVRGGMTGRYCATGIIGQLNRKVEVRALWVLADDANSPQVQTPVSSHWPLHESVLREPVSDTPNIVWGLQVKAAWHYGGSSVELEASGRAREPGYLSFEAGDHLTVLSPPEPGHAGNLYKAYVYAEAEGEGRGWVPRLLLFAGGAYVAMVLCVLTRPHLNGRFSFVKGMQKGRYILEFDGNEVAIKAEQLWIFDDATGLKEMISAGSRDLLRSHPLDGRDLSSAMLAIGLGSLGLRR